jgi:hypothetical protein
MGKTFIYVIVLGILAYGVYYFIIRKSEGVYADTEAGFTIKDTANIGRIFISVQGSESILLERSVAGWKLQKQYIAQKSTIDGFLKMLSKQSALYPVPKSMHNNVISTLAGNGIKVELDDLQGKAIRIFYVGGETADQKGTFMLVDGASRPYVVNLPNYQGTLSAFYTNKVLDWRDRTVFDVKPENIASVSIKYPEHNLNSFTLNVDNGKVNLNAHPDIIKMGPLNLRRSSVYLKFFEKVSCEGYLLHFAGMDSILKTVPKYAEIEVHSNKGQLQHVDVYWMPLNRRSKNANAPTEDIPDSKFDADRFFAVMNNYKDTVMVQSSVFEKTFRKAYEFFEADPAASNEPLKLLPEGSITTQGKKK